MDLFVGNIPDNFTHHELAGLFGTISDDISCRIVIRDEWGVTSRYGVARVEHDADAVTAIRSLNTRTVDGQSLVVREFHHRSSFNECRALNWRQKQWHQTERRLGERRGLGAWFKQPTPNAASLWVGQMEVGN